MRQTRPTSTNLQDDALISASPIVIDSGEYSSVHRSRIGVKVMETYWALLSSFVGLAGLESILGFSIVCDFPSDFRRGEASP